MQFFCMSFFSKLCLHFHLKMDLEVSLVKKVYQQVYKQDCQTAPHSSPARCAGLGSRASRASRKVSWLLYVEDVEEEKKFEENYAEAARKGNRATLLPKAVQFSPQPLLVVIGLVYGDVILTLHQRQSWLA